MPTRNLIERGLKAEINRHESSNRILLVFTILLSFLICTPLGVFAQKPPYDVIQQNHFKIDLSYAFIILFITLGPLKTIPVFLKTSKGLNIKQKRQLAFKGMLYSAIIVAIIATIFSFVAQGWKIDPVSLMITGGILLFISASKTILNFKISKEHHISPDPGPAKSEKFTGSINKLALSPIAVPAIITPIGVLTILYFVLMSHNSHQFVEIIAILAAIIFLNLTGMLFSERLMALIGLAIFQIIAWIFAIMQSVLAIQFIIQAFLKINNVL